MAAQKPTCMLCRVERCGSLISLSCFWKQKQFYLGSVYHCAKLLHKAVFAMENHIYLDILHCWQGMQGQFSVLFFYCKNVWSLSFISKKIGISSFKLYSGLRILCKLSHQMQQWYRSPICCSVPTCLMLDVNCVWFKPFAYMKLNVLTVMPTAWFLLRTVVHSALW